MTSQRLGLYIIFILMCLRDFNLNTLQQNCDVKGLQFGYFLLSYKKKKLDLLVETASFIQNIQV